MTKPEEIVADFRIVTPMFLGDARGSAPDVRPPSVKGALRFWWRALHWSQHRSECRDDASALQSLHAAEARLFGTPANTDDEGDATGGQGAYLLRVRPGTQPDSGTYGLGKNTGLAYIGYGMRSERGDNALPMNTSFCVRLIEKPRTGLNSDERQGVRDALHAWGLFGGLGARARRAFGSVAIEKLDGDPLKYDRAMYLEQAYKLLARFAKAEKRPPFSALSSQTHLQPVTQQPKAGQAHEELGTRYREQRTAVPVEKRVALGTPIESKFWRFSKRRASVIFMHIHPVQDQFLAVALYMPAQLHTDLAGGMGDDALAQALQVTQAMATTKNV